jgi:hypothetical protein
MWALYIVLLIYGGTVPTHPSPWVIPAGQFSDQPSCTAAGQAIAASPDLVNEQQHVSYVCAATSSSASTSIAPAHAPPPPVIEGKINTRDR